MNVVNGNKEQDKDLNNNELAQKAVFNLNVCIVHCVIFVIHRTNCFTVSLLVVRSTERWNHDHH